MISSFLFFAVVLVGFANGYHVNMKTLKIQQTGMINVNGNTKQVLTSINGSQRSGDLPQRFSRLMPGKYEVKVTKENCQDWEKTVLVKGGKSVNLNNVILYLKEIKPIKISNPSIASITNNYNSQKANISIDDSELRYNNQLITRFSQNIKSAIYDENTEHFYVQLGDEIRTMDFDGSNNYLLFKIDKENPIIYYTNNQYLYYIENNQAYQAKIQ
jgi:hypothetical protein